MRTEKELLELLRKRLIKTFNIGKDNLYLCNMIDYMDDIDNQERVLLHQIIKSNHGMFISKFDGHYGDAFWTWNDFHNRYEALNYLINKYEQKERITSIASFGRSILNYLKIK